MSFSNSRSSTSGTAPNLQALTPADTKEATEQLPSKRGFLSKARGMVGYHKRYFVLEDAVLTYYSSNHDQFPLGYMSIHDIVSVNWFPGKKDGRLFEVTLTHKVYTLVAESKDTACEWVSAIEMSIEHVKNATHMDDLIGGARNNNGPATPRHVRDVSVMSVEDVMDEISESAQNHFRLAFYKTALKRNEFMQKLVTECRSDAVALEFILKVLLEPPKSSNVMRSMNHLPVPSAGSSVRSAPNSPRGSILENDEPQYRSVRSAACTRYNPHVHRSSFIYTRVRHVDIRQLGDLSPRIRPGDIERRRQMIDNAVSEHGDNKTNLLLKPGAYGRLRVSPNRSPNRSPNHSPSPNPSDGASRPRRHVRDPSIAMEFSVDNAPEPSVSRSPATSTIMHRRRSSDMGTVKSHIPAKFRKLQRSASNFQRSSSFTQKYGSALGSEIGGIPENKERNSLISTEGYDALEFEDKQAVYDWIISDDFLEKVCIVFGKGDFHAQKLALRCVWILLQRNAHTHVRLSAAPLALGQECPECTLASEQMEAFMQKVLLQYCSKLVLDSTTHNAVYELLHMLVSGIPEFNRSVHSTNVVRNHGLWRSIFVCLHHAKFSTRRRILKDVLMLLIKNPHNCESILCQVGWHTWILPLLYDVPKQDRLLRINMAYSYTIMIYTVLHLHCYENYTDGPLAFSNIMRASLVSTLEVQEDQLHVMRDMINTMLHVLQRDNSIFSANFDGAVWQNLVSLMRFVKAFIFTTPQRDLDSHQALYTNMESDTRLGLHAPHEVPDDIGLLHQVVGLLVHVRLEQVTSDMKASQTVSDEERAAIEYLIKEDFRAFFTDSTVFLQIVFQLQDVTEEEMYQLLYEFVTEKDTLVRKKIFKGAADRHKVVMEAIKRAESKRNRAIEQTLQSSKVKTNAIINLLLLGPGESGKSTVFKQLIGMYGGGFDTEARRIYIPLIYDNVVTAAKTLAEQSDILADAGLEKLRVTDEQARASMEIIKALEEPYTLTPDLCIHIRRMWNEPPIQATLDLRGSKFQLAAGDSAPYYFNSIESFCQPNFVPSEDDILRTRLRTTGIVETDFRVEKVKFHLTDVGGQRSERKKWIHCFQDVNAVIFVAAISEYDQVIAEDGKTNRLQEALDLFEEIVNLKWFKQTPMILFLNKRDLFFRKLQRVPLQKHFPEFGKYKQDYKHACAFIRREFKRRCHDSNKEIYISETCATDREKMKFVFDAVRTHIVREALRGAGLMSGDTFN
jgi:GTPase SAR1 family protein